MDYGPMTDQVVHLILALGELSPEQIGLISLIADDRGPGERKYAVRAADAAGRDIEIRRASAQAGLAVERYAGMLGPARWSVLQEAAGDACVAVATMDLIGFAWYGQSDFDRLIAPIREAVPEAVQNSER